MFHKEKNRQKFLAFEIRQDFGDVIAYTDALFDFAIEQSASDVHVEPNRDFVSIRFRVSGDFVYVDKISHEDYAKLLSRFKILANLRIDEKYRPQDGKISYVSEKYDERIDIRVSILPIVDGEKVVMRILRQDTSLLSLDKLDFLDLNMERITKSLESRYGIVLVAGPTGSGKSTTLFSMLKHFDPLQYNISTLEDPVEYNIPFINQSQIRPQIGFNFADGLRSLVRQDPDIIMVGEIRDKETAMLAIEAALTGHLVLSTIHTNSATGTTQRLINMGIEPFLISSALKMVISQRLVKRLCPKCAAPYRLEGDLKTRVAEQLSGVVDEDVSQIDFSKPVGCPACDGLGYTGRIGAHEVLVLEESLSPLILEKASVSDLDRKARELGMITIMQDALIKSAMGKTSIEEALQLV
jgi:type II secretory ATPase GspE/PulE/Tfp pilus assembly ATPase PilB-like protein